MAALPIQIIAEAGVNHNGDLNLAKKLIDCAAAAGADYIKFQTFRAEDTVSAAAQKAPYQIRNTSDTGNKQLELLRQLELNAAAHQELYDYCQAKKIKFLSTAFDEHGLDLLKKFNLDFYKIPSGEITNAPFLRYLAEQKKPLVVSTGMSNLLEIEAAIQVLEKSGCQRTNITLLQCTTAYPCPVDEANLTAMQELAKHFGTKVGFSDHTPGIEVSLAAAALGASIIEKHLTLDRNLPGPDHQASIEPQEFVALVKGVRIIEKALGSGIKTPSTSERENSVIARKSIHLKKALKAGHCLSQADLVMKRPGNGISPMELDSVVGSVLKHDLPEEHQLQLTDLI